MDALSRTDSARQVGLFDEVKKRKSSPLPFTRRASTTPCLENGKQQTTVVGDPSFVLAAFHSCESIHSEHGQKRQSGIRLLQWRCCMDHDGDTVDGYLYVSELSTFVCDICSAQ
jgi:hypothetical protein